MNPSTSDSYSYCDASGLHPCRFISGSGSSCVVAVQFDTGSAIQIVRKANITWVEDGALAAGQFGRGA